MLDPKAVPVLVEDLEPNSEEWLAWRANFKTASEAAIVLGISPFTSRKQFKLIKAGLVKQYYSKAMQDGHDEEEGIRQHCNKVMGKNFKEVMYERGEYAASLDGYDSGEVLEIKNSAFTYNKLASGEMDQAYLSQMEQQMYCSGAKVAYLAARNPKTGDIIISDPVYPDPEAMAKIDAAWDEFEAMPMPEGDLDLSSNLDLLVLFERYVTLKQESDRVKAEMDVVRAELTAYAPERTVECRGHKIIYKEGAVRTDYRAACTAAKLDLDPYKKQGEPSFMIKLAPSPFEAEE